MPADEPQKPPEHNTTGHDYALRSHFRYAGPPIIDFHAHVTTTKPTDSPSGPPGGGGADASTDAAAVMLDEGTRFGVGLTVSMCPPQDIAPLRERLGDKLLFNAMINPKPDDPPEDRFRQLDQFLEAGVKVIKFWSAPRGRERGLFVDAPWRVESLKIARSAGVKVVMVHVGDPDAWWGEKFPYADAAKFGTKESQYAPLRKMLELFPDLTWVGAHMGGNPEHPEHLAELLDAYPHLMFDTSATKWQVREVSRHPDAIRALVCRYADRFLFGTDIVTRHGLPLEHYTSRYWCQRTLWESDWRGPSPIADPDYVPGPGEPPAPYLAGVALPDDVLRKVYYDNAAKLLGVPAP